ncbi:MAG: CBS domain-containing protein [Deltaproteobacteria bacterium]|nr:MAG: CBS domain-containing protein [Deltaproteobacteria bacterium]
MLVRDYMTTDVVFANLRDGLHQTLVRMHERGIRHMPVLDDHERLAGIVSERDLRRPDFVDPDENHARAFILDDSIKVEQAMSPVPATVTPDDDALVAVDLFVERHFGALPVVEGDRVVGIISTIDLLRALRNRLR